MRKLYDELAWTDKAMRSLMRSEYRWDINMLLQIYAGVSDPLERERIFEVGLSTFKETPWVRTALEFLWMAFSADKLYKAGENVGAIEKNLKALRVLFNGEAKYLSSEFYNADYLALFQPVECWSLHLDMVSCCGIIAQSFLRLGDVPKALEWHYEVEVLYDCINLRFDDDTDMFKTLRYHVNQMQLRLIMAQIFTRLGNTAIVAYYVEYCVGYRAPKHLTAIPEIMSLNSLSYGYPCIYSRHPDLSTMDTWDVEEPSLQVRGIWEKLPLRFNRRPPARRNNPVWLWCSKVYVFGGTASETKSDDGRIYDIWCLDLKMMDGWRRLPDVPVKYQTLGEYGRRAVVYGNHAWIFNGQRDILCFNMISEKWDCAATKMPGHKWPFDEWGLVHPCIAILKHFMYVFGGDLRRNVKGSDIFMVLNLKTLRWRYLGDSSMYKHLDYSGKHWPPFRRNAGCWIVPKENSFYLMYGTRDLNDIFDNYDEDAACNPYHTDLWSFSIDDEVWTRQRLRGNYPCPREDMGIAYHPDHHAVKEGECACCSPTRGQS